MTCKESPVIKRSEIAHFPPSLSTTEVASMTCRTLPIVMAAIGRLPSNEVYQSIVPPSAEW